MARGLITGGYALVLFALGCTFFVGYWPMYLVSRTELVGKFCWEGDGIWATQYRWGDDIDEIRYKCNPEAGGAMSTYEAYCESIDENGDSMKDRQRRRYSQSFRNSMCKITTFSKALVIAAMILSFLVFPCAFIASFGLFGVFRNFGIRRDTLQATFSGIASILCLVSALSVGTIILLMSTSPLFSQEHYQQLSKGFLRPYPGISCVYQIPLPSLKNPSFHGPMRCLFPGPSFACCLMSLVSLVMAFLLFALKYREVQMQRRASLLDVNSRLSEESDLVAHLLRSPGTVEHTPGLPNHFLYDRHYSLYGAFKRRLHNYSFLTQHLVTVIVPLLNVSATLLLAASCLLGIPVGLFISIETVKHKAKHDSYSQDVERFAQLLEELAGSTWNHTSFARTEHAWHLKNQLTEYAPITVLRTFITGGAILLGIMTLISSFIWPSMKSIIWLWFWYAPADEVWRGRFLTWIDSLGKLSLPNLYVIVLLSIADHWYSTIIIPWYLAPLLIPPFQSLQIRIDLALKSGPGTTTYTFSYMFSLILGEIFVALHRTCKHWEEVWRDREDLRWRSGESVGDSVSLLSDNIDLQNEISPSEVEGSGETTNTQLGDINIEDTPYFMMYRSHRKYHHRPLSISPPRRSVVINNDPVTSSITAAEASNTGGSISSEALSECVAEQLEFYDHVEAEALCDKMISPLEGQHHRFTLLGKALIVLTLFIAAIATFYAMESKIFTVKRSGLIGNVLVEKKYKVTNYSIFSLIHTIDDIGDDNTESIHTHGATTFKFAFILFTVIMPFVHLLGLAILWLVPMKIWLQKRMMHFIEIAGAWSTIDIFAAALIGVAVDLEKMTNVLLDASGAETIDKIIRRISPSTGSIYATDLVLRKEFLVLVAAIILEKVLQHFIVLQFATMLSERAGLHELRRENLIRKRLGKRDRARQRRSSTSPYYKLSTRMVEKHKDLLSPGARFYTASTGNYFYAGQFLFVWRAFATIGLIKKVENVQYFVPPFEIDTRLDGLEEIHEQDEGESLEEFSLEGEE